MQLQETMLKRRSVRAYTSEKPTREQVDTILKMAMSGPSAHNNAPWEFYVISNDERRQQLRQAAEYANYESPLIIIVAGNMQRALPGPVREFWIQDCSAAIENVLLAAADQGLGSCWCGIHPNVKTIERVQKVLDMPEEIIPLGLIHIGYPAEEPEPRTQFDEQRVHRFE